MPSPNLSGWRLVLSFAGTQSPPRDVDWGVTYTSSFLTPYVPFAVNFKQLPGCTGLCYWTFPFSLHCAFSSYLPSKLLVITGGPGPCSRLPVLPVRTSHFFHGSSSLLSAHYSDSTYSSCTVKGGVPALAPQSSALCLIGSRISLRVSYHVSD